jgi:predicted RNA binding protein YcfA (HicA-like mRNA interferase family)
MILTDNEQRYSEETTMSYRTQQKLAAKAGFQFWRQGKGSHQLWRHPDGRIVLIAVRKLALRKFKADLKRKAKSA